MNIARVQSWVLRVPFHYPLFEETSYATTVLLEIETEEGLKGHAMSGYPMAHGIRELVNRNVAPLVKGKDAMAIEEVRAAILWGLSAKYFAGAFACAASLVDIALWDIKGKATGQPVWKLLGGSRSRCPAYITFGLGTYTQEQLVEVARMLVAQGQSRLKMVVAAAPNEEIFGRPSDERIAEDIARVAAVRGAIGPKVELMVDANKNASLTQALQLARGMEPYNLTWFEDPLLQADPRLMAQLRQKSSIPLAAGSTGTSDLLYFREYLLHNSVDYLQPNVRDIGGYTGGLKAAAVAQAFNIQIQMGGNWPHINMHLHGGAPNGGRVEFHWQGWHVVEVLFDGAPPPTNGWVTLPEALGLGFTPKEGIVREYAVE
ncbi:MAG: mandelate racemase/muconate lactonizing enzyme family protein [Chloroflexi bacterium]|nr:mandelate racemase/muconate lactonizing enzyme family protein [Chloroflexota bacterium]